MDYCGPRALPRSEFLAWPEEDQDAALWWVVRDRQRCGSCGTHPDDWNPEVGGHKDAYCAEVRTCPGCQRRGVAEAELSKERESGQPKHGAHVVLIRTHESPENGE